VNKRTNVLAVLQHKIVNKGTKSSKISSPEFVWIIEQSVLTVLHNKGVNKRKKSSNSASPWGWE